MVVYMATKQAGEIEIRLMGGAADVERAAAVLSAFFLMLETGETSEILENYGSGRWRLLNVSRNYKNHDSPEVRRFLNTKFSSGGTNKSNE
jgi:hypothetical protein